MRSSISGGDDKRRALLQEIAGRMAEGSEEEWANIATPKMPGAISSGEENSQTPRDVGIQKEMKLLEAQLDRLVEEVLLGGGGKGNDGRLPTSKEAEVLAST